MRVTQPIKILFLLKVISNRAMSDSSMDLDSGGEGSTGPAAPPPNQLAGKTFLLNALIHLSR